MMNAQLILHYRREAEILRLQSKRLFTEHDAINLRIREIDAELATLNSEADSNGQ